jgi:hypothetical protein
MNATTTVPTTIQLSRGRLTGLMLAAAGLAAGITCAVLIFAVGNESAAPSRATSADVLASLERHQRQFVEGIMALTPAELAAAYGAGRGDVLSTLSPTERRFVEGISSMSPEQIAAGYGNGTYLQGILSSTPEELAAAFGNRFDARSAYVQGIMESTPEELAAAFGR